MSDVLYDATRAKTKCTTDQLDEYRTLLDTNTGDVYPSFLRTILEKAENNEPHKCERENSIDTLSDDDCSNEDDPQCEPFMVNLERSDILYDAIRAKNKCTTHQWDDDRKLVDSNIENEYQRFLGNILEKAGKNEPHECERENNIDIHQNSPKRSNLGVETRYEGDYQTGSSKKIKVGKEDKGKNVVEIAGPRNIEVIENQFVPSRESSEYRNQVLCEMRKPFNRKEYYQLKYDVHVRKPIERHMDLRNGRERSYALNKYGKSFLDHYPDLVPALNGVQGDRKKRLKLLRGFFFWLQNVSREESFRPWRDAECLAVVHEKSKSVDHE